MKIIFLHGLESTPETSSTAKLITDNFDNVHVPHYYPNMRTYSLIIQSLKSLIDHYENVMNEEVMLVGISIGGYWALKMTEFTNVRKVILINPAIIRGAQYYNGMLVNTPSDVMGKMILNMDDDIVDNKENFMLYKDKFSVTTFQSGGHRATNKKQIIEAVKKSVTMLNEWNP